MNGIGGGAHRHAKEPGLWAIILAEESCGRNGLRVGRNTWFNTVA